VGDLSDFEKGQIVDVSLAGASVTKRTVTLLGVSTATVSKVMLENTNHGKKDVSEDWETISIDRK
jgi:hypothetical protein